ncbi:MAG: TIR domain-containing protein [Clostridia bacterium]|nr:TIR domain-containing protein [Clostridia bacterium]
MDKINANKDIFISFSSKDLSTAESLVEFLEKRGYDCFISSRDVLGGESYPDELEDAIKNSKLVVLIFSENADKSVHVRAEMSLAFSAEKTIIPFKITTSLPVKLNYFLQLSQWIEATNGDSFEHLESLFNRIYDIFPPKGKLTDEQIKILNVIEKVTTVTEILTPVKTGCYTKYSFVCDGKPASFLKLISDIKIALNVFSVRVTFDRGIINFEVENGEKTLPSLKSFENLVAPNGNLVYPVGVNEENEVVYSDLTSEPHLLISGVIGSELLRFMEGILKSISLRYSSDVVKFYCSSIFGGFKSFDKSEYLEGERVITSAEKTMEVLGDLIDEMERRYSLFNESKVRNISGYNAINSEKPLKYIVYAIDEFSALEVMMKKDFEKKLCTLLQKSRASGIHLIISTARFESIFINGVIKANIPSRIVFYLNSSIASRSFLNEGGAELLTTNAFDFLRLNPYSLKPERLQGFLIDI